MSIQHEIVQTESGRYALFVCGEYIGEYARKFTAERGLSRVLKRMEAESADTQTDSREAAAGCVSAQLHPTSNTGGKVGADDKPISEKTSHWVMDNGKLKEIPLRKGVGTAAHIDTLTFTFREDVLIDVEQFSERKNKDEWQKALSSALSSTLFSLFGFGIYESKKGINGYTYSFKLGTETANYGLVAFGGKNQRHSIMVYLYGEGLTAAKDGWENCLYSWITVFAPYARITRCDLAHDFLDGQYTPDDAYRDWRKGLFMNGKRKVRARQHGYDWLDNQRTGKTFYVGMPNSSKMLRVYDKGCEQGDYESPWVRVELQLRGRDCIIPHEVLIAPGEYLTAAYPAFEKLFGKHQRVPEKIERIKKTQDIALSRAVLHVSNQASGLINVMQYLDFNDSEIVRLLKGGRDKFPKRLNADKFDCHKADVIYLHQILQYSDAGIKQGMNKLHQQRLNDDYQAYLDKIQQDALLVQRQNYQHCYTL